MEKGHKLDVQTFSIIPLQSGVEVDTPEGRGTYEGITSSGIVKVHINGGIKEFSWSEVTPDLSLRTMQLIDELQAKLVNHVFITKVLKEDS